jgi:nucleoside-diphosphate-sugar epimerase
MILVTGGTGLVGAHLLLYLIESKIPDLKNTGYLSKFGNYQKTESLFQLYNKSTLLTPYRMG